MKHPAFKHLLESAVKEAASVLAGFHLPLQDGTMCTVIFATGVWPDAPLVVASNRDERLGRASEAPRLHRWGDREVLAPRDLEAGGSWLGINDAGVFVAITNRFVMHSDPRRKSRGALVRAALEQGSLREAVACAEGFQPREYNPFHLLIADREAAHCVWSDGDRLEVFAFNAGVHVLTERSFHAAPSERLDRWRDRLDGLAAEEEPTRSQWQDFLGEHSASSLEGTCVHWPERDYGTRSSFLLRLGRSTVDAEWSEGPACTGEFQSLAEELKGLAQRGSAVPSVDR